MHFSKGIIFCIRERQLWSGNEDGEIRYVSGSSVAGTSALSPGVPRHMYVNGFGRVQRLQSDCKHPGHDWYEHLACIICDHYMYICGYEGISMNIHVHCMNVLKYNVTYFHIYYRIFL